MDLSKSKKRKLNSNNQQTATIKTSTTLKEAETFKYLPKHANIIKFIEIIEDPEHQDSIFLVTEIAEKGIVMDVKPHSVTKPYSNTLCRDIFEQLVEAVDHCRCLYINQYESWYIKLTDLLCSTSKQDYPQGYQASKLGLVK